MKRILKGAVLTAVLLSLAGFRAMGAEAAENDELVHPGYIILEGTTINGTDVSGMTEEEALAFAKEQVEGTCNASVTLKGKNGQKLTVKASDLGVTWSNPEIIEEAGAAGYGGNILTRYKNRKEREEDGKDYIIEYTSDRKAVKAVVKDRCTSFDSEPVDGKLEFQEEGLVYVPGQYGYRVRIKDSVDKVCTYLDTKWNHKDASVKLKMKKLAYEGTEEDLGQCTSILGTYTTYYYSSTWGRRENIATATNKICGTILYPGQEFSTLDTVCPFTFDNGYQVATAYANNKVVDSLGGGACQVSTTLYNAVLRAELEVSERHNHSMTVSYVQPSEDACITSSGGLDFKFINDSKYPVYIYGKAENGEITMSIYGKEERPENREVEYQPVILSRTPSTTRHEKDSSMAKGRTRTEYGYTGYSAELIKIVREDGNEVSRDVVNKSRYAMTPTIIYEGTD